MQNGVTYPASLRSLPQCFALAKQSRSEAATLFDSPIPPCQPINVLTLGNASRSPLHFTTLRCDLFGMPTAVRVDILKLSARRNVLFLRATLRGVSQRNGEERQKEAWQKRKYMINYFNSMIFSHTPLEAVL